MVKEDDSHQDTKQDFEIQFEVIFSALQLYVRTLVRNGYRYYDTRALQGWRFVNGRYSKSALTSYKESWIMATKQRTRTQKMWDSSAQSKAGSEWVGDQAKYLIEDDFYVERYGVNMIAKQS